MRLTLDLRMIRHSGIGRYLRNVVPLLLPQIEADRLRVLSQRTLLEEAAWLRDPRVELVETAAPIYSVAEQKLPFTAALRNTDLLWVPHYNVPLVYTGKTVVTLHDIAPIAVPEILPNPIKRGYARLLIERAARHASAVLAVSEFTRDELISKLQVPAARITVTHPGLDADWPLCAEPHAEPGGRPYLLYVGNVKPNKNLTLLLAAFASVAEQLPYQLLLVGRMTGFGTGDEAALRQAQALGDRVRFAGEVSDAELQRLYAGAAALVMPSLYEGFGLPLLEAMQLGCPVLASSAGSLPEVGGDAALYFDPHSSAQLAQRLIDTLDPALMGCLRERGRARVQQFSFERCARQTAEVFNRLLHGAVS